MSPLLGHRPSLWIIYFKKTEIQKIQSDESNLTSSIPQGSVLGCVMFLIYINDLPKFLINDSVQPVLFADDLSILVNCKNKENLKQLVDETLNKVTVWLQDHNLEINKNKTKIMEFRSYKKPSLNLNINYQNTNLQAVDSFDLLGLSIDTHLNWKSHIELIKSKLAKFTYALYQLKRNTNIDTALAAYYAYAYSWLRYGIMLWGTSTNADELFVMQKKCVRILAHIDHMQSCKPYFKKYKLLTLTSIYIQDIALFVHKNIDNFKKIQDTHSRNTRHKNKLYLPPSRLTILNQSPFYMCIKIYNHLPGHLIVENNINQFKKMLNAYLVEKCFYTLNEFISSKQYS
jgi:hypothetical protein